VAFTFIQSAGFMLNALGWSHSIRELGVQRTSTGQGKIAFIHPDDIADVAAAALITRDHDGQSLVITGPEALSYGETAAIIGGTIGKRVRFEEISDQRAYTDVVRWAGNGPYTDALVDIWRAVREGRLATVSDGGEAGPRTERHPIRPVGRGERRRLSVAARMAALTRIQVDGNRSNGLAFGALA
jgi:uncharacterized protein YbjT (DUF2867 family)